MTACLTPIGELTCPPRIDWGKVMQAHATRPSDPCDLFGDKLRYVRNDILAPRCGATTETTRSIRRSYWR
jgi:hypothetical protein